MNCVDKERNLAWARANMIKFQVTCRCGHGRHAERCGVRGGFGFDRYARDEYRTNEQCRCAAFQLGLIWSWVRPGPDKPYEWRHCEWASLEDVEAIESERKAG